MAKWTLSEYDSLPVDGSGNPLPMGRKNRNSRKFTAGQATIALQGGTRFIRFCGDTAAHVKLGDNAADTDEYVAAGDPYWVATEGYTLSFIAG